MALPNQTDSSHNLHPRFNNTGVNLSPNAAQPVEVHSSGHPRDHRWSFLPPEIILHISRLLSLMGRTSDLAVVSSLNKSFAHISQEILFSHVHVHSRGRCAKLVQVLQSGQSERGSQLASMVRRVTATLDPRTSLGEGPFMQEHLLDLYNQFPRLESITLTEEHYGGLGAQLVPDDLELGSIEALHNIRSLTLRGSFRLSSRSLLLGLPRLVELRLFGVIPEYCFTGSPPHSGPTFRRVIWGIGTPPSLKHIKWLFAQSSEVTGGEIVLLFPPITGSELERIHAYAASRGMELQWQMIYPNGL